MSRETSGNTSDPHQGHQHWNHNPLKPIGSISGSRYEEGGYIADIDVKRFAAIMPISCCLLTDSTGENHCAHEPIRFPGPTRWQRFRAAFKRRKYQFVVWLARLDEDEICNEWYWREGNE